MRMGRSGNFNSRTLACLMAGGWCVAVVGGLLWLIGYVPAASRPGFAAGFALMVGAITVLGAAFCRHFTQWRRSVGQSMTPDSFRSLVQSVQHGVLRTDPAGRITFANAAYARMLGRSADALLGTSIWNFADNPLVMRGMQEEFQQIVETQPPPHPFVIRNRTTDGRLIDLQVNWSYDRDEAGELRGFVFIASDVTDRERTANRLRESEERLRFALDAAEMAGWDWDLPSGEISWTRGAERLWGYPVGNTLQNHREIFQHIHPDDRRGLYEATRAAIANQRVFQHNFRVLWPNGKVRWLSVRGRIVLAPSGVPERMAGVVLDIHEGKALEAKLIDSKQRLERILASLDEVVFVVDAKTRTIVMCNDSVQDVLGYSPNELIGRSTEFLHVDQAHFEEFGRLTGADLNRFGRVRVSFEMRRRDGRVVKTEHTVRRLDSGKGDCTEVVSVIRDVTELKQAREQLEQLNTNLEWEVMQRTRELTEKNEELEAFAYTISHDLRAPLRAVEGFAVALREDYEDRLDDEGRQFLTYIEEAVQRMDSLIQDLLTYSQMTRLTPEFTVVSLDAVIADILGHMRPQIEQASAIVKAERPLGEVLSHAGTLRQVLINLLDNALKFSAPGRLPRVRILGERIGKRIRIWVEDNGIGIPRDRQTEVFGVFKRLHGVEAYPGTGIGLAIVQSAVERLGGACGLESQLGEGSRFWIELPAADSDAVPPFQEHTGFVNSDDPTLESSS